MFATAQFNDTWAGFVPAHIETFRTTSKGERVKRYRWIRDDGQSIGLWRVPSFKNADVAILAAMHVGRFINIHTYLDELCVAAVARELGV